MWESCHLSWLADDAEGVVRSSLEEVGFEIAELPSQKFDPRTSTIGGFRDIELAGLRPRDGGWSSLLLPLRSELGDPLAMALSRATNSAVLACYEYDQCAWGFAVFVNGARVEYFWNAPDFVQVSPESCSASAEALGQLFAVDPAPLVPYLTHRDLERRPGKAHADDEFELGDHWVRVDFMRRLGIAYANPGSPGFRHVRLNACSRPRPS